MPNPPTVGDVIGAYIRDRDLMATRQKALDEELATMKGFQKAREKWLQGKMKELGATSLKAAGIGTCFEKRTESVKVDDWDALLDYAIKNDRLELIKKGVSKTVALEYMGEKRDQELPPGVGYVAFVDINIRRS